MAQLYTVADLAAIFKKHPATIRQWIADGLFPHVRRINGKPAIPASDVQALMKPRPIIPRRANVPTLAMDDEDATCFVDLTCTLRSPCIYFLVDDWENVLYVGQSVNLFARVATHLKVIKEAVRAHIKPCATEKLDATEEFFIQKYKPPYNAVSAFGIRLHRPIRKGGGNGG